MKRRTTRLGDSRTRNEAKKAWTKCWTEELTQKKIQSWIERIKRHFDEVILLDGGNEYREGREIGVVRPYNTEDRRVRYHYAHLKRESTDCDYCE